MLTVSDVPIQVIRVFEREHHMLGWTNHEGTDCPLSGHTLGCEFPKTRAALVEHGGRAPACTATSCLVRAHFPDRIH